MKKQKVLSSETEYQWLVKPPELDELAKSINILANAYRQRERTTYKMPLH